MTDISARDARRGDHDRAMTLPYRPDPLDSYRIVVPPSDDPVTIHIRHYPPGTRVPPGEAHHVRSGRDGQVVAIAYRRGDTSTPAAVAVRPSPAG